MDTNLYAPISEGAHSLKGAKNAKIKDLDWHCSRALVRFGSDDRCNLTYIPESGEHLEHGQPFTSHFELSRNGGQQSGQTHK